MITAPAARPEAQEARGGKPPGSKRVRITNPVLNKSPFIRLKDAERLVKQGRAVWVVPDDQLRLNDHPANRANAAEAAAGYARAAAVPVRTVAELRHIPMVQPKEAFRQLNRRRGR